VGLSQALKGVVEQRNGDKTNLSDLGESEWLSPLLDIWPKSRYRGSSWLRLEVS
jgi:hypothetical protein